MTGVQAHSSACGYSASPVLLITFWKPRLLVCTMCVWNSDQTFLEKPHGSDDSFVSFLHPSLRLLVFQLLFISVLALLHQVGLLDCWAQWTQRGFRPGPWWHQESVLHPETPLCPCFISRQEPLQVHSQFLSWTWNLSCISTHAPQSGSLTWARCPVDRMFSSKPLSVSSLSTSPEWSPGPAGLRVWDPCLGPPCALPLSAWGSPPLPTSLHPPTPAEGFALGS